MLAVLGGSAPFLVLVLVRDDHAPFVSAEVDRLAALIRVAVGTPQLHDLHHAARRGRAAVPALP